jgi:small-conductance mechanosensitive channel
MLEWVQALADKSPYLPAAVVLVAGFVGGYLLGRINDRLLRAAGVPAAIEATSLERTARKFGTDTVSVLSRGSSWIIYVVSVLLALEVADLVQTRVLLSRFAHLLPSYVLAVLIVVIGLLGADKAEVRFSEYLRGVKFPEVSLLSSFVRYTVIFVAILLALSQIGIAVGALLVLLAAYLLGVVVLGAVAFHQLLVSGAIGLYLILQEPYCIGDRIEVGDREGIVQEITLFVTRIENDGREFIIPNHLVFREGAVLVRG